MEELSNVGAVSVTVGLFLGSVIFFILGEVVSNLWVHAPTFRIFGDLSAIILTCPVLLPLVVMAYGFEIVGWATFVLCVLRPELLLQFVALGPVPMAAIIVAAIITYWIQGSFFADEFATKEDLELAKPAPPMGMSVSAMERLADASPSQTMSFIVFVQGFLAFRNLDTGNLWGLFEIPLAADH